MRGDQTMTFKAFIDKHRHADAPLSQYVKNGVSELHSRLNEKQRQPPAHIDSQLNLITDVFDTDETVWLFFFDAGRYDMFEQLYPEYFTGELHRCYNGGVGYTGDWTVRHLTQDFGERGLFSYLPLRGLKEAEYDGRNWFSVAPDINAEVSVHERLAELGYAERRTNEDLTVSPALINDSVKQYQNQLNGGVIQYIAPHPPFDGLEDLTSESTKTMETQAALEEGELTYQELTDAYEQTYRKAFRHAVKLIPMLDGEIYITSDHGTCLTCGQLFHGRQLEMHDHLTIMPWFKVSGIV